MRFSQEIANPQRISAGPPAKLLAVGHFLIDSASALAYLVLAGTLTLQCAIAGRDSRERSNGKNLAMFSSLRHKLGHKAAVKVTSNRRTLEFEYLEKRFAHL